MMHFNIKSRENTIYPLYIKPCETNMMLDSCQNRKNLCVLHYVCCLLCIFWYDIYDVTPSLFIYIILLLLLFMLYPIYVFVCVCVYFPGFKLGKTFPVCFFSSFAHYKRRSPLFLSQNQFLLCMENTDRTNKFQCFEKGSSPSYSCMSA